MPSGVYPRTEKHSFNKGRKHPNRKSYFKGIRVYKKVCASCRMEYSIIINHKRSKYCSLVCLGNSKKGTKHPNWINDRNKLKLASDRNGQLHRMWSRNVKIRDKWKCKLQDGQCFGRMESHHILRWSDNENLRYELSNGITLCHFHHPKTREKEDEMVNTFKNILAAL